MSGPPENPNIDPNDSPAQQAVRAFVDSARQSLGDQELSIALISTGAAMLARIQGPEPAIAALRRAIKTLRAGAPK